MSAVMDAAQPCGVFAHGLQALIDHMLDGHLPKPWSITVNDAAIQVWLDGPAGPAWVESIAIDSEQTDDVSAARPSPYVHHVAKGRLPDTGVRVELWWAVRTEVAS